MPEMLTRVLLSKLETIRVKISSRKFHLIALENLAMIRDDFVKHNDDEAQVVYDDRMI